MPRLSQGAGTNSSASCAARASAASTSTLFSARSFTTGSAYWAAYHKLVAGRLEASFSSLPLVGGGLKRPFFLLLLFVGTVRHTVTMLVVIGL